MLKSLFGLGRRSDRASVDSVYEAIVAAARQPVLYSDWDVPDTPLGRFEMISLMMVLLQHRLVNGAGAVRDFAQDLMDEFFKDVDHSLRELGIGDLGVPKRIKKLARMYFGRTASYVDALNRRDADAFAAALTRNVRPEVAEWPQARALAGYAFSVSDGLAGVPADTIVKGSLPLVQAPGDAP